MKASVSQAGAGHRGQGACIMQSVGLPVLIFKCMEIPYGTAGLQSVQDK